MADEDMHLKNLHGFYRLLKSPELFEGDLFRLHRSKDCLTRQDNTQGVAKAIVALVNRTHRLDNVHIWWKQDSSVTVAHFVLCGLSSNDAGYRSRQLQCKVKGSKGLSSRGETIVIKETSLVGSVRSFVVCTSKDLLRAGSDDRLRVGTRQVG
ncbi:hypothetical protein BC939DRAFT_471351 [Gamsiella multidivaricata]|uniref:uncharacterized protein n=1 Tax=Gamsiella multidivaricata TaxID=101098 RepID=UPI0022208C5C|nr:uncharacterized protein BC939DRAFT_471351 [Gamsiella multidivaricata]KAI7815831.1 hypothetical protein BC939DRAFT_471351 [Gamsiella multidivaricata]